MLYNRFNNLSPILLGYQDLKDNLSDFLKGFSESDKVRFSLFFFFFFFFFFKTKKNKKKKLF